MKFDQFMSYSKRKKIVKKVSCLGIWWRHNIWIPEKFDYLKNEKSYWNELKINFPCSANALFWTYKAT